MEYTAFYKEIKLILNWITFSLLVHPSSPVPVSDVLPYENYFPTPVPGMDGLVSKYWLI